MKIISSMTVLAQNLKFLRKSKNLSQEELAVDLGLKRSNIAAYEVKGVEPRLRVLSSLARYYNISLQYLISEPLAEEMEYPQFYLNDDIAVNIEELHGLLSDFKSQTDDLKEIFEGLKSFYLFKKEKLTAKDSVTSKLINDIDELVLFIDFILEKNSQIIESNIISH